MFGTIEVKSELNKGTSFIINLQFRAIDKKIFYYGNEQMNKEKLLLYFNEKRYLNYCPDFY